MYELGVAVTMLEPGPVRLAELTAKTWKSYGWLFVREPIVTDGPVGLGDTSVHTVVLANLYLTV